jgi:hypothetical protein
MKWKTSAVNSLKKRIKNSRISMKVKLNIAERLLLGGIFPQKGAFEEMLVKEDILNKVKFDQDELKKYDIHQEGTGLKWSDTDAEFDFDFTELEENTIVKSLKEKSEKKELGSEQVGLYKKFVSKPSKNDERAGSQKTEK